MDPATLTAIYSALALFGLVVTDSYYNANTMYLDTTVSELLVEEGYEPTVVDGIFVSEVKKITKTPSLVKAPSIESSKVKPVSAALAEFANLEAALEAVQGMLGVIPPKMVTSVIVEDPKKRIQILQTAPDGRVAEYEVGESATLKVMLTGYDPKSGYFDVDVEAHSEEEDVDHVVREAAFAAVLQLDPYLALLYDMKRRAEANADLAPSRALIDKELALVPPALIHEHRALVENLRGVLSLLEKDLGAARSFFKKAVASDPKQPVGYLNLAFVDVHEDRYLDAIRNVEKVIYPSYWPMTGDPVLLANGYIIKAVAETEMENFKAAEASFRSAVALHPQSSEAYVYWARMLRKAGRQAEAERKFNMALQNAEFFENFPEMALLYFWLTEEGTAPLDRRESMVQVL